MAGIDDILDALISKKEVIFKSQQRDEPELTDAQKKSIAINIFNESRSRFLSRFGSHLRLEDLQYFEKLPHTSDSDGYEVKFHLERLKKQLGGREVRNRRYAALRRMKEDPGGYFSETVMMRREPLLYDQLVGQFLTEEEKKLRDGIDTANITFVNLLLESIDRKVCKSKLSEQQEEESLLEDDSSSSPPEPSMDVSDDDDVEVDKTTQWGEFSDEVASSSGSKVKIRKKRRPPTQILLPERRLLHEEFNSLMYESFISGKDKDFDYASVDNNEEYDNLEIRNHDAEESYFDSESPQEVVQSCFDSESPGVSKDGDVRMAEGDVVLEGGVRVVDGEERRVEGDGKMGDEEEDELDVFMERLNQQESIRDLAKRVHNM